MDTERVARAISAAGGVGSLAQRIGITTQAISQWKRIPHLRVHDVAEATGIPLEELRPDLFRGVTVVRPEGEVVR
ncbi:transcriptional regulator [Gluconacetobacter entanii]|uniref:transcriptional regulator n=1 Tax=Gluconacetobacter entanii TaxID=108528 RepID=UPI0021BC1B8C|nr:helix-turn-helix domain-containing protein [Gluconacetobacter entanii]MCW4579630.1 helix-turn-helix domain-containing protein [Gluconacetobacter entanii]MCW4583036.1 helix-turn-helix domain-containing protein [Gluconacetobacter entanii]MCW4586459.1 helix-turn-helix domain-containing protein [Gluconacetobacter entanii]